MNQTENDELLSVFGRENGLIIEPKFMSLSPRSNNQLLPSIGLLMILVCVCVSGCGCGGDGGGRRGPRGVWGS